MFKASASGASLSVVLLPSESCLASSDSLASEDWASANLPSLEGLAMSASPASVEGLAMSASPASVVGLAMSASPVSVGCLAMSASPASVGGLAMSASPASVEGLALFASPASVCWATSACLDVASLGCLVFGPFSGCFLTLSCFCDCCWSMCCCMLASCVGLASVGAPTTSGVSGCAWLAGFC